MTTRICLVLCLSVSMPHPAPGSEKGGITGIVQSQESGQGLPFATILLEQTEMGTTSDEKGEFRFEGIPEGTYTLVARLLGYEEARMERVVVRNGRSTRVIFSLAESAIPLEGVQVTAERARRQEDLRPSIHEVTPFRIKTLAGVAEDVMRTLQALPGVISPNDFTSQLIIRGSGPDQNLIIMDDIEIFNPYRLYGMISMFNPETVTESNLITGGFPAKYGDRLSAVFEVANKEGDRTVPLRGSVNASITNANVELNGRSPLGIPGSYVVSARRTYYDLILGPIAKRSGLVSGDVAFPNFADFQTKLVFGPWDGHKLVVNGLTSMDGVKLVSGPERKTPDSVNVIDETRNDVLGFSWHYVPSASFYSKLGFSWYRNKGTTEFGGDFLDPALNRELYENGGDTTGIRFFNLEFDSRYEFTKYSLREHVEWMLPGHAIEAGGGIDFLGTSLIWQLRPDETLKALLRERDIPLVGDFVQEQEYERLNLFAQDRIRVSKLFMVQPGLRLDYYSILDKAYLQPRFNALVFLDPLTTVRAAWGHYYQSPGYEKLFDQNVFFDLTGASSSDLDAGGATHYLLGLERWIDNRWQVRVETYFKRFSDIIVQDIVRGTIFETSPVPGGDRTRPTGWTAPVSVPGDSVTTTPVNEATGSSYGFELLLEKKNTHTTDRLTGWISYALSRSFRVRDAVLTPFQYDRRHTVNIVLDFRLNSWLEAGVRWNFGTGFPYTPPVGLRPRIVTVTQNGQDRQVLQTDSQGRVIFDIDRGSEENRFSARLPDYHRLDIRLTAHADYWDLDWSFYLDIINAYNHKNVLAYRFYVNDDITVGRSEVHMLPILPTLGLSVRF